MASHPVGPGSKYVSTSVPAEVRAELQRRARAGGWRSLGAYVRAVLEHHAEEHRTIAERRTFYEIPAPPGLRVAEQRDQPEKDKS
jgi:hypothetical protein